MARPVYRRLKLCAETFDLLRCPNGFGAGAGTQNRGWHRTNPTRDIQRQETIMATTKQPLAAALGAAFLATAIAPLASAGSNPFSAQPLSGGYDLASFQNDAEGKCGEGKCGGEKGEGEGKCGGEKGDGEGKCGEGKCGGEKKGDGEGKCG